MTFLFPYIFFASFGMACEVIFTAMHESYYASSEKKYQTLKGHSYIYMIPVYSSIYLIADIVHRNFWFSVWYIRYPIYLVILYCVEYVSGFLFDVILGKCPWNYNSKYSLNGYINFAYAPFWTIFLFLCEWFYFILKKLSI